MTKKLIDEKEFLEHAYFAPLDPVNTPESAFECNACGEMFLWNKNQGKLQCWNEDCSHYSGGN